VEGITLPTITNTAAQIAAQDTAELAANIFADLKDTTLRVFPISRLLNTSRRGDSTQRRCNYCLNAILKLHEHQEHSAINFPY
jgi:hypothetical protein